MPIVLPRLNFGAVLAQTLAPPATPSLNELNLAAELCPPPGSDPSAILRYAKQEIPRLRNHCDLLKAALEESQAKSAAASQELDSKKNMHLALESQYKALSDAYDALEKHEAFLSSTLDDVYVTQQHDGVSAALKEELLEHEATKKKLSSSAVDLANARSLLKDAHTELTWWKGTSAQITNERDQAWRLRDELQLVAHNLTQSNVDLRGALHDSETRTSTLDTENKQLQGRLAVMLQRTRQLEADNAELVARNQQASIKAHAMDASQERVQSDLEESKDQVKSLKSDNDRLLGELAGWRDLNTKLTQENDTLTSEKETLVQSLRSEQVACSDLQKKFDVLGKSFLDKHNRLEGDKKELERQLNEEKLGRAESETETWKTLRGYMTDIEALSANYKKLEANNRVLETQHKILRAQANEAMEKAAHAMENTVDRHIEGHIAKLEVLLATHKPTTFGNGARNDQRVTVLRSQPR